MTTSIGDADDAGSASRRTRHDPRRERTRARLLGAARVVFERDGFHNAKLSDITTTAGVAAGTLYNYYDSKHGLFRDIMRGVADEMRELPPEHVSSERSPAARLREVNRVYLRTFRRHARLLALLFEAGANDPELGAIWAGIADHFQHRATDAIERWQSSGLATSQLDPVHLAHALTFMVERLALAWANEPGRYDEETLIETVNVIWITAIGLADT